MYAGFPEVAYFDDSSLGVGHVRLFLRASEQRLRVLRRLGLGGLVGIVLSLPILVPSTTS